MVASTTSYQGGPFVEVFSSSGSNPLINCKLTSEKGVQKVYEKGVKGYVYTLSGASSKLQLPKDERKAPLRLLQQFLVLQIYVPAGQHFALEMGVLDGAGSKRKLYFSTAFHEVKATPLHCQVPLTALERDAWLNLAFNLVDLFGACFRGVPYKSLDLLVLGSVCHLRKIFTLRTQPIDSSDPSYTGEPLPSSLDYPSGAQIRTQVLNAARIKDSLAPGKRMSEDSGAAKAGQKRPSGSTHVAFGSRMAAPAPLVVVPANVVLSQREDGNISKGVQKATAGQTGRGLSSRGGEVPTRGASKQGSVAPSIADEEEDAGEEWSPTENKKGAASGEKALAKKQAGNVARVPRASKQKAETLTGAEVKGEANARRSSKMLVAPKKEVAKKAVTRAESPVAAWEQETPDESLLASMSSEWQKLTRDACAAEKLAKRHAGSPELPDAEGGEVQSSRSSSRASSRKERLTVHFGRESEALSDKQSPAVELQTAQLSDHEASPGVVEEFSEKTSTDARDVLAELERELAELTAGTKNSPRAALWRSEVDGFLRSPAQKSKQDLVRRSQDEASAERKAGDRLASGPLLEEEESRAIREEKLLAVSALEEWEGQREKDSVNGASPHDDGTNEHWRERGGGVNEHFEVHHDAASSASQDTWKSRRSNSRYSQESEDSDVTPRASRHQRDWEEQKGSRLAEKTPPRLVSRGSERGRDEPLVDSDEQKHPISDWEAEDDARSSLGSLEGSEWGARLSRERRTLRGSKPGSLGSNKAQKSASRLSTSRPSSTRREDNAYASRNEAQNFLTRGPLESKEGLKSRRTSALETSLSDWTASVHLGGETSRSGLTSQGSRGRTSSAGSDVIGREDQRPEERGPALLDEPSSNHTNAALRASVAPETPPESEGSSGVGTIASTRLEDMDLLFDPILRCFYDPKTNKYYELKEDEETLV